jgi:hypothetical protein
MAGRGGTAEKEVFLAAMAFIKAVVRRCPPSELHRFKEGRKEEDEEEDKGEDEALS